jgi:NTE family protein
MPKSTSIGIALSGGGARGIAHIGVIKALEDHGFEPKALSGASAGAVVACLYAAGKTPEQILEIVKKASLFKLLKVSLPYSGLTNLSYLKNLLVEQIGEDDFSVLKKPLYVAISNLNTGDLEIRDSGKLFDVITASSSIPLVFQPVEIDGAFYVDGGLLGNLPVGPLKEQTDVVIGVNVMPHIEVENKSIKSVFGIAQRCFDLSILANTRPSLTHCDLLVEPKDIHPFSIFQLNRYQKLYDIGYAAMESKMDELKAAIQQKSD